MRALQVLGGLREFFSDVLGLNVGTRTAVLSFLMAVNGEPLDADGAALFTKHTQRPYVHRPDGFRQGVLQAARQVGKSEGCAAHAVYTSVGATLAGRRDTVVVAVAQDHRSGQRALFGHMKRFCERPLTQPLVQRVTADTIELAGGNTLYVLPCRPQAIRGLSCIEVLLDEVAHFRSTDNIPRDRDMVRAALPTLSATGGRLIEMSSPGPSSGLLYDQNKAHYGVAESDLLYWVGGSEMNPTLSASFLQHQRDMDPESARAELDAEFLQNVSTFFDAAQLDAAVDVGVKVRDYIPSVSYRAGMDHSSGTGKDLWCVRISHGERDGTVVLDAGLDVTPKFSPESAARESAALLKRYHCHEVWGDKYAPGFTSEALGRHGITYRPLDKDRSQIYLELQPLLTSGKVRFLDDPDLLREARGLERHRGPVRDKVDHRRGGSDDRINAAAIALVNAAVPRESASMFHALTGEKIDPRREHSAIGRAFGLDRTYGDL